MSSRILVPKSLRSSDKAQAIKESSLISIRTPSSNPVVPIYGHSSSLRIFAAAVILATAVPRFISAQESPDLAGRVTVMSNIEAALDSSNFEQAEELMADFRRLYSASSRVRGWENGNEVVYLYKVASRLADGYAEQGDFKRTLAVYEEELAGLTMEVPHYSWRFLVASIPYHLELGTQTPDQARAKLKLHRQRFQEMAGKVESSGRRNLFEGLVSRMESALLHLDLIGHPAPDFNFEYAFGAQTSLTLESLRGKVVLIDFWATWCAPCMAAWPWMAELYESHGGQDFEILSITSIQGGVGAEKGLTPERELELTRDLIERHAVTWPVVFSDRSVNDPEYGASTLPCYAIVDRDGRVVRILVGEFDALGRATLDRLLS